MLNGNRHLPWPRNLWSVIFQKEVPAEEIPHDWEKALQHVSETVVGPMRYNVLMCYFEQRITLERIGKNYGISRSRVQQHLNKAIEMLQEPTPKIILTYGLKRGQEMLAAFRADNEGVNAASVKILNLSARTNNCLRRGKIETVGQLRNCTDTELLRIRNLGESTLAEIKEKLSELAQGNKREPDKGETYEIDLKQRLIADIGAIRAENAKTRLWDSDERIADYLLSKGWTLPTRCGTCSYKFANRGHNKVGCPLDRDGMMNDNDFCSCGGAVKINDSVVEGGATLKPSIILSQRVRLEGVGHNVLVLGTAGTGKTRYYILPNLLQCCGSYVVVDTAGSLYRDTSWLFKEKGYEIKTFDVNKADAADIDKFDAATIGREPTVIYIILGFNNEANSNLVRPLVQKIMAVCSFATEVPVHLFLDEFGCIAEIPDFPELLNRTNPNLSCTIILQSIAQLQEKYKETWKDIVQRCDTNLYFGGGHDWRTCEYLSGLVSQQKGEEFGNLAPDEIRKMRCATCLILAPDQAPIIDKVYDPEKHCCMSDTPVKINQVSENRNLRQT